MKKGLPWASPSLDACNFLNISEEGPWGASPSLGFCSFPIFLHHLALGYLKLPSWKTYSNFIKGLVLKNKIFLQFQSTYQELIFYNIRYCHKGLSKALVLKKKSSLCARKKQCKTEDRICQKQNGL